MTDFGGLGGVPGGRPMDPDDLFEMAVNKALGDRIRASDEDAAAMWSALANVVWIHDNGDTAAYSFRAAGDLVSAIRGDGNYLDWYCQSPDSQVAYWIHEGLEKCGWRVLEEPEL